MNLQADFRAITNCIFENYMILNSRKCHFISASEKTDDKFRHNGKKFSNSKEETILGVIIGNKLSLDSHINRICKKAGQKLSAFSRISVFTDLN